MANGNGLPLELEPFAAAVARLSNETLRIEFKNDWREGTSGYETGVIGDVKAGKADLGWAGSRAFDSVGVPAFDALHAPLLIDSYALEQRVLQSPLVGEMLDGLKPLGVVGLGILPGPLRKPLGVSRLVRPADYRRQDDRDPAVARCRADAARARRERRGNPVRRRDRRLDGVEQEILSIAGRLRRARQVSDREREPLAASARHLHEPERLRQAQRPPARPRCTRPPERAPATLAIAGGGEGGCGEPLPPRRHFVTAATADLAALRRAVQPVYDHLQRDAQTKAAIEQIHAMRSRAASTTDAPTCSRRGSRAAPRARPRRSTGSTA